MKNINEELQRMLYLTQHKRGVVISEQNKSGQLTGGGSGGKYETYYYGNEAVDWRKKSKGVISMAGDKEGDDTNPPINAKNVRFNNSLYNLTIISHIAKYIPIKTKIPTPTPNPPDPGTPPIPGEPGDDTVDDLLLTNDAFPYPDNMIGPKFNSPRYKKGKQLYETFINDLTKFILKGGVGNIKGITVQGFADSAAPTLSVPAGYSKLDHNLSPNKDTVPYGGLKKLSEMNVYLAQNRGEVMRLQIIQDVLTNTGVDISDKIKTLPGVSYYGQKDKRGQQFRSIEVKVDYTPYKYPVSGKDETSGMMGTPGKDAPPTEYPEIEQPVIKDGIDVNVDINNVYYPAKLFNVEGKQVVGISAEVSDKLFNSGDLPAYSYKSGLNGKLSPNAEITDEGVFIVNEVNFGEFFDTKEVQNLYPTFTESKTDYLTLPKKVMSGMHKYDGKDYDLLKDLSFGLTTIG